MRIVGALVFVAVGVGASGRTASADCMAMLDQAWPAVEQPTMHRRTMTDAITDQLTDLGNELGHHMNVLSHDSISLSFDGRARHAKVRVGGGDDRYFTFAVATDIQFTGMDARVKTRIDMSVSGHRMHFDLPEFEMEPQSYQGDRVVVLLVPFLERRW